MPAFFFRASLDQREGEASAKVIGHFRGRFLVVVHEFAPKMGGCAAHELTNLHVQKARGPETRHLSHEVKNVCLHRVVGFAVGLSLVRSHGRGVYQRLTATNKAEVAGDVASGDLSLC